jgi:nucleotide-binding universal stress UspA family protein
MNPTSAPSSLKEPHLKTTRIHFDNVLVAVDMSAVAANTLKIAAELAGQFEARLIVAHVLDPALMLPAETATNARDTIALWMRPHASIKTRSTIVVAEGDVVHEITRLCKQFKADLLVIGTHAVAGAEKLAFGSKAEVLFRHIGIPVLTVGPHVQRSGERFSSILLPTDLEPHSFRAAQYAVSLAEESAATLTLLHVLKNGEQVEPHQAAALRMDQLVPEDAALWCEPVFRTCIGDPPATILATARQVNADLIVMGVTHARPLADHASWSIASKVVRHAECPVLTVRDRL